jgi:5'-deoxynucleotidase YfbR-like HD superfamily hydrolase
MPPMDGTENREVKGHESIRAGGAVRRYHTRTTIGHQTVAEHSWGVACILLEICDPSVELLGRALYHDVAERETGDIPAQFKRSSSLLMSLLDELTENVEDDLGIACKLTKEEECFLRAADILELLWYCLEQRQLGNTTLDDIWERGVAYMDEIEDRLPPGAVRMLDDIKDSRDALFSSEPSSR